MAAIKSFVAKGWTDWCHRELQLALNTSDSVARKIIQPISKGFLPEEIGTELKNLPDDIKALAAYNVRFLHDDLFSASMNAARECTHQH